jgi:hypothetical protein
MPALRPTELHDGDAWLWVADKRNEQKGQRVFVFRERAGMDYQAVPNQSEPNRPVRSYQAAAATTKANVRAGAPRRMYECTRGSRLHFSFVDLLRRYVS